MLSNADTLNGDTTAWLIRLLGDQRAAQLSRPLTDEELALVDAGLAAHNGDPVAALGIEVDADTAAIIRSLPVGGAQ
jgi:glycosyltransferase A (GT-A) superfamily protein (DUF2064 family)